jgi:hypothetical protein
MNHTDILNRVAAMRVNMIDLADRKSMLLNLIFVYQVARTSETILREAAACTNGALHDYYKAHLQEEIGHENWLEADLKTAGIDVKTMPLFKKAIEMAGSQYYLLKHFSKYCLLGYMLVVEGFPLPMNYVDDLEKIHGKDVLRTVRYHSVNDLEHRQDLFDMIDQHMKPEILQSAIQTAQYFNEFINELNSGMYDSLIKDAP